MQEGKDAGKETVGSDLDGQTSLWTPLTRRFGRECVPENTRRRGNTKFKEQYPLLSCSLQCHLLKL